MPNWCSNSVAFIAEDDTCLSELEKLRNKLIETGKKKDGAYLCTVLAEHGMNADNFSCRGEICEIREIETTLVGKLPCFIIVTETAWSPTSEMWDAVLEKYKGIFNVYTAEESGMGIYINTDDQGYCFTDMYRFECYITNSDVLNKTSIFGIGRRFYENNEDGSEYFESDTSIIAFFSMITGRKFFSLTQINDFCESISLVSNGEICFCLNEFRME